MANNESWHKIFRDLGMEKNDFTTSFFEISAKQIKEVCQKFNKTSEKEPRLLCKQDSREDRPEIFIEKNLFILPVKNGHYIITEGEGYTDIPEIKGEPIEFRPELEFELETLKVGDSEMQHLDYAFAINLITEFMKDNSLILSIRGRKYTKVFDFKLGKHKINTESVQIEVDAGYEGKEQLVLVEAKNSDANNIIIRQLYYPYRMWGEHTNKKIVTLFFQKGKGQDYNVYSFWKFEFTNRYDYNSIKCVESAKYRVVKG